MVEPGTPATPARGEAGARKPPWSLIAFAALAVYALLIILFNTEEVKVSFVFFSARISKIVLILLCLGIGFAAGFLLDRFRARRGTSP